MQNSERSNRPLIAAVIAAVLGSVCCVGPLILLALGVSGAWIANLTILEPYRPIFIGLTLVFLGLAFRKFYLVPQVCSPDSACADRRTVKLQRTAFWVVSAILLALLTFPWYGPLVMK